MHAQIHHHMKLSAEVKKLARKTLFKCIIRASIDKNYDLNNRHIHEHKVVEQIDFTHILTCVEYVQHILYRIVTSDIVCHFIFDFGSFAYHLIFLVFALLLQYNTLTGWIGSCILLGFLVIYTYKNIFAFVNLLMLTIHIVSPFLIIITGLQMFINLNTSKRIKKYIEMLKYFRTVNTVLKNLQNKDK
jgi:hypothetical protein